MEETARKIARRIVDDAGREVDARYEQARLDGYRDGIALFVDVLIGETTQLSQTYAAQLARERDAIARDVEMLFTDTETVNALIEEYLGVKDRETDQPVSVHLPRWCRLDPCEVDRLQANSGRRLALSPSPNDRLVIGHGPFSLSFTPAAASTQVCARMQRGARGPGADITAKMVAALLSRAQQTEEKESP
ncbi:hypothetical protein OVY01_08160 [Robbsia sp. Bb-Pol-6]|uniref:Uncharacterized protein n=1 Tax=Robbsia betulipollinis TaxID=2981849 RepID=A0ABT3ZKY7_9BURK|nr:hypothetical protein [Robbsia betulipollinis]MCY0387205.1 hypothetical protein [Robbsia betulipollinis]